MDGRTDSAQSEDKVDRGSSRTERTKGEEASTATASLLRMAAIEGRQWR